MVVATSEPPATQRSTSTPMTASGPSAGPNGVTAHMLGMLSSGNQFSQTATHIQGNAAVANQGAYMGGRLTPQAMQQGKHNMNSGAEQMNVSQKRALPLVTLWSHYK